MRNLFCLVLTIILIHIYNIPIHSQVYFSEDFESGSLPTYWKNSYIIGSINWEYQNGGYTKTPTIPYTRKPYPAHGGSYNALFVKEGFGGQTTKLETKAIDLSIASKPVLSFWHAQAERYYFQSWRNDELTVYYRLGDLGNWVKLVEYTDVTNNWTQRNIPLPDSLLSNRFYIAFEAKSRSGWGVCIDDIEIYETDNIPKVIENISLATPTTQYVATSSDLNQIARLDVKTKGNQGSQILKSITFTSANTSDIDISNNGVKLFMSADSFFTDLTQIGTAKTFASGSVTFNNINYTLPTGNTYLWLTYDIDSTATVGNYVDAKLTINSINISDTLYPETELDPTGKRQVFQSIFSDGFEYEKGWILSGEFERGSPMGLGGVLYGISDPDLAFSGDNVLGVDLSDNGDYESSISLYSATTPTINCKYFKNIHLQFMRWLNVDNSDKAGIDISTDDGLTWQSIWTNTSFVTDKKWTQVQYNLSSIADRQEKVKFRFTLGPTNESWNFSGWNIDNLIISGDFINNDVGVTSLVEPISGCGHTNNETVKVYVKNFAPVASANKIPLYYSFDNGVTKVYDTLRTSLASGADTLFSFATKANLSAPDLYNQVKLGTALSTDEDLRNDIISDTLNILPTYSLPFSENFESSKCFWLSGGTLSTWALGMPQGDSINYTVSGSKVWVTNLYSFYNDNEESFVESPCFNIPDTSKVIFELKYFSQLQAETDGARIEYSTDDGNTWSIVPKHNYPWSWNWYNSNFVTALNSQGWGLNSGGWLTAKQVLPEGCMNQSRVKFRILFKSDYYDAYEGFAFDDVKIYEAPINVELLSITSHSNACQNVNPNKLSFTVKNNGIRSLISGKDKIIAAYKIDNASPVVDTLSFSANVGLNAIGTMTFNKKVDLNAPGTYNIKIYTLDPDAGFYPVSDNDTIYKTITIYPNPVTNLTDTFKTARLDTFKIIPNYDTIYTYKWSNTGNANLSTDSILQSPPAGNIWLTMTNTDANHCETIDTFFVKKLIPDVGIAHILSPVNACELGAAVKLNLSIRNKGDDTIRKDDTIRVAFEFEGGSAIWDTIKLTSDFEPGDTLTHLFNNDPMNMSTIKTYSIKSYTAYKYDSVPSNDTLIKNIIVFGYPTVYLGQDDTVAGFKDLHPGANFKTYLWSDGTTDSVYRARYIGNHWVRITDEHDCPAYDTVYLRVVIHDVKPDTVINPHSSCSLSSSLRFKLRVKNFGTDTIMPGEKIRMGYSLNNNPWEKDSVTMVDSLFPGETLLHQFSKFENFSAVDTYYYKAYTKLTGDIDVTNDTLEASTVVFGYPHVNLGPDTTVRALSYTLDGGTGNHLKYKWQDNSTNKYFNVTSNGTYSIRVTDTLHNCITVDTSHVIIEVRDGTILSANIVSAACENKLDTAVVEFKNNGNIDIPSGDTVYFGYIINDGVSFSEAVKVNSNRTPGSKILHTFRNLKNKLSHGSNNVKFFCIYDGDLRPENDTLETSVVIWPLPSFSLGGNENDTLYTTPPYKFHTVAGTEYSYTWQDNSHDSTYTVNSDGLYHVKITDNNFGCFKQDTVYVKIFIPDGGITNIISAPSGCKGIFNDVSAQFTNLGNVIIPKGEDILFVCEINGGSPISILRTLNKTLQPNDTLMQPFTNIKNIVKAGTNDFKFYSVISNDIHPDNDTATGQTIIYNLPAVELGGVQDTIRDFPPVILDGGSGSNLIFDWSNGETDRTISVENSGWYKVTVTNTLTTCSSSDSVFVDIQIQDGSITESDLPSEVCDKALKQINVTFKNTGNLEILNGEQIVIYYSINGSAYYYVDSIIPNEVAPNQTIVFRIIDFHNQLVVGNNTINYYCSMYNDLVPSNDNLDESFIINPLPDFDLGGINDSITSYPGYILNTELSTGYSHLWNDNTTEPTNTANVSQWYTVKVTNNTTSCDKTDSVYVNVRIPDGSITDLSGKSVTCHGEFDTIIVKYKNSGNEVMPAGDTIWFTYKVNNGLEIEEFMKLSAPLGINATINYIINGLKNKVIDGVNTVFVESETDEDLFSDNDTASFKVTINPLPIVSLGGINDTISGYPGYELSTGLPAGYDYLWNDNSTDSTLKVYTSQKYSVKVTNTSTNCQNSDSVYLKIRIPDGALVSLTGKNEACEGAFDSLTITFQNTGDEPIAAGDTIWFYYKINNGTLLSDFVKLSSPIAVNEKVYHVLKNLGNKVSEGDNTINVEAKPKEDIISNNNSLSHNIKINALPSFSLGGINDTIISYPGYIINTELSDDYSFLWNDHSTDNNIQADNTKWYSVKVTNNATSCTQTDSVFVKIRIPDGSIVAVNGKHDACPGDFDSITVVYKNSGNIVLAAGDTIWFHYKINNGSLHSEFVKLNSSLGVDATLEYIIKDLSSEVLLGENIINIEVKSNEDIINTNDTVSFNITINPFPEIILGGINDTIISYPGYILTTGLEDGYSHLWSDESTENSLTIDYTDWYNVSVTNNATGCKSEDSVFVKIEFYNGSITSIIGNTTWCEGNNENISVEFTNTGNMAFNVGDTIGFGYSKENEDLIIEQLILEDKLEPGDKIVKQLGSINNLLTVGSNEITFFPVLPHDFDSFDDTVRATITINALPNVNLGGINDTIVALPPVLLQAPVDEDFEYKWQDNSTESSFTVSNNGLYYVTVNNTITNCSASDTVEVITLFEDGTITDITGIDKICKGEGVNYLLTIENKGNTAILKEETINIILNLDGINKTSDTIKLASDLQPGNSVSRTFDFSGTLFEEGENKIKFIVQFDNDLVASNDTNSVELELMSLPEINLANGEDSVIQPYPFVLDANIGDEYSYIWNNSITEPSISLTDDNWYKVEVTNKSTGCKNTDSVYAVKAVYDIQPIVSGTTIKICKGLKPSVPFEIKNIGNIDLTANDTIEVTIKIQNNVEAYRFKLTSDFTLESTKNLKIDALNLALPAALNTIKLIVTHKYDVNHDNDTSVLMIEVVNNPVISLANNKDTVSFTNNYTLNAGAGFASYLWSTKATTPSISINKTGWVSVIVSNQTGCKSKDSVYMKLVTSIIPGINKDEVITLYPNPVTDATTLIVEVELRNPVIEIISTDSRVVIRKEIKGIFTRYEQKLDLSKLKKGIYYLKMYDKTKVFTKEIVVQ